MPQMHRQDNSDWSKDSRVQFDLQSVSDAFFSLTDTELNYWLSRDDASASLFKEAGVELRRFNPISRFRLSQAEDEVSAPSVISETKSDSDTINP